MHFHALKNTSAYTLSPAYAPEDILDIRMGIHTHIDMNMYIHSLMISRPTPLFGSFSQACALAHIHTSNDTYTQVMTHTHK